MTQPARIPRERPAPSAPARPEITYQFERFPSIAKEIAPLFERHWREIAVNRAAVPLDPNWELFLRYDLAGVLCVLTVRADGALVGYIVAMVGPHLHYATTWWCHVDMFYLVPEHRRGWIGVKMFVVFEKQMRELNVKVVDLVEKLHFKGRHGKRVERLFRRLKYRPIERVYRKLLG